MRLALTMLRRELRGGELGLLLSDDYRRGYGHNHRVFR